MLGDQPRRHAFQRSPGGDHLDHLDLRLAHDIDAAPWHGADETFALELRHRLAHRGAADAEVLGELALVETDVLTAAIDVHRHDDVLQRNVGLVLEAERGVDRLDGKPRRGFQLVCPAGGATHGTVFGHLEYNIPRCNTVAMPVVRCAFIRSRLVARASESKPPESTTRIARSGRAP